jgi:O-antigen ligase
MLKDIWSLVVSIVIVSLLVFGIYLGGWYYNVALAYIVLLAVLNPSTMVMLAVPEVIAKIPIKRVDSQWVDKVQTFLVMLLPFFVLVAIGHWIVGALLLFSVMFGLINGEQKRNEYNRRKELEDK